MGNFNKDIYMKGCHLVARIYGDTSNMYQFVFNPDTAEFSDIYSYDGGLRFELDEDGKYSIVTIQHPNARLVDDGLEISGRVFTAEQIAELLASNDTGYYGIDLGTIDLDDTFSICKLKKCLAALELKVFQEMAKNCGTIICKDDVLKSQRDFLFIAV
jgi:hypothetical protein